MRKSLWLALLAIACALCACAPVRPGNAIPASASPAASPVIAMSNTPTSTSTPTNTPMKTQQPSPTPSASPAYTAPVGFEGLLSQGLAEHWLGSQAVVVRAKDENSPIAELWLYEKTGGQWKAAAGPWPAVVGKNGMTKHVEGENRSPSGAYLLGAAFGWADAPDGINYPYHKLEPADRWISEPTPFYNRWVHDSDKTYGDGESLYSIRPQYEHCVVIHYNDECTAGAGGAIFLHVWRNEKTGTAGCTAVSSENMKRILQWLDYSKRPVLVQGTEAQLTSLMNEEDWGMLCLPSGWGFADDYIPDAQLDIRYNTENNFTGSRIPGYNASLAPMRTEAIEALKGAADELRKKNIGICIYDAYRPQEASDAMMAWAEDVTDTATKKEYYPDIDKAAIPGDYVASKSNHRLGGTVDLTLIDWKTGKNLDMGGPFDFFGDVSAYGYDGLTAKQAANRKLLRDTMLKYGFKPYDMEWWHFTFPVDGDGGDFPILPREFKIQ